MKPCNIEMFEFDTIADFISKGKDSFRHWFDNLTPVETIQDYLLNGYERWQGVVTPLVDEISNDFDLPVSQGRSRKRSTFGPRVNVKSLYNGDSKPFRRVIRTSDNNQPVRIFVDLFTSGSYGSVEFEKRGIAILALHELVSSFRQCEIHIYKGWKSTKGGATILKIGIQSRPIDYGTTAHALCDLSFSWQCITSYALDNCNADGDPTYKINGYDATRKQLLGITDRDIDLPPMVSSDGIGYSQKGWIEKNLEAIKASIEGTSFSYIEGYEASQDDF